MAILIGVVVFLIYGSVLWVLPTDEGDLLVATCSARSAAWSPRGAWPAQDRRRRAPRTPVVRVGLWYRATAPIGIFDSGVGGLTVTRDHRPVARRDIVYIGDTGNGPYGGLTIPEIRKHALAIR